MPRFSIIIPAYNNADLLERCLESVEGQSFADWEAVVVNDASSDNTGKVIRRFAKRDQRVVAIDKPVNEGLHLARKSGTEKASGDYVLYLDADDELMPDALDSIHAALEKHPTDLLRLGTQVEPAGASQQDCEGFESRANQHFPTMSGQESIHLSYEPEGDFQQDWRTWGNVITNSLAKSAYDSMTDKRLERAEDALEFLAFTSLAKEQVTRTDIVAYRYYFGSGVSGVTSLSAQQFCKHAHQFADCLSAIDEYAETFTAFDLKEAARGAHIKLSDLMFNDWKTRVPDDQKEEAYPELVELFGEDTVAAQLMRLVRDAASEAINSGAPFDCNAPWMAWREAARQLMEGHEADASPLYRQISVAAERNIANLRKSERKQTQAQQDIRIFVSAHADTNYFDSDVLQMVQVGSSRTQQRLPYCFYDDQGDNISNLNPMYCELTSQYWAWKNADASYYGFCHYRRYFNFSDTRYPENDWGEIIEKSFDADAQMRYGLDDESIRRAIDGYDVITTEFKKLSSFPGETTTPIEHWHAAASLYDEDLIDTLAIVCELHPDYSDDVAAFASGETSCFCNMFIMRKEIFDDYCSWLFPILERFCETHDMSRYSRESLRTPGHLGERLLNIYLMHCQRLNPDLKMKQCQCVHFEDAAPLRQLSLPNVWETKYKPIIPVVFAADDSYAPMLATTIQSMLYNASDEYHYDIIVLTREMSRANQEAIRALATQLRTARVEFLFVDRLIDVENLKTNNPHISVETYYRFLIQDALPDYDKVVYLDADLIVQDDISKLFAVDLGENMLAAVRDVDYLGNLNLKDTERLPYSKEVLGMKDPYDYFQAGVLVLNTKVLREEIPVSTWIEHSKDNRYIYNDQDILNACCEGRVVYLDPSWNVMHDGCDRISNACRHAPVPVFEAYLDARTHEKIIHYAGSEKPWNTPRCDRIAEYWEYARMTSFYEQLLALFARNCVEVFEREERERNDYRLIDDGSALRKIIDPILPPHSQRREMVRSAVKVIRGKKS